VQRRRSHQRSAPERREVALGELEAILEKASTTVLGEEDVAQLRAALETLGWLQDELSRDRVQLQRLLRQLFGPKTEKATQVLAALDESGQTGEPSASDDPKAEGRGPSDGDEKGERKGHGRNGAAAYTGAQRTRVPHPTLRPGDPCPECPKGKVYPLEPKVLIRVTGQPPLSATATELETLRCNLCGEVFRAPPPEGLGDEKYDARAAAMIGVLRYGSGLPMHRLDKLQGNLGIPLPATTQWEIAEQAADLLQPAHDELIRQAARGEILHNDDTSMRVLTLMKENARLEAQMRRGGKKERTGIFTSSIVAVRDEQRIALFITGRQHAGENLGDVLKRRAAELQKPLQMSDASSMNPPKELETILGNCLAHARRNFVDVLESFPAECRHVIEALGKVYHHDAIARNEAMTPDQRLRFHQEKSAPVMDELQSWMTTQIEEHRVEPNSGLGAAIHYMLKRWDRFTLFLSQPAAPLDNSICERALKKAVLHRKGSLFYKTLNGARVGDLFMSLIYSAELAGANPFDYLSAVLEHRDDVARCPEDWMPWNYRASLDASTPPTLPAAV